MLFPVQADAFVALAMGELQESSNSGASSVMAMAIGEIQEESSRRGACGFCNRPLSVCLCPFLPPTLIPTTRIAHLLLLQHPHEARHKLSTLPLLRLCLANCQILVGRRFRPGSSPLLDHLASLPDYPHNPSHQALLLFPGPHAADLRSWFHAHRSLGCHSCNSAHHPSKNSDPTQAIGEGDNVDSLDGHFILLVVDGTWRHAKEMVKASAPFLNSFAVQVCLPFDTNLPGDGVGNSDLILRKEPFAGCVTTMEAVASCLNILEPNGSEIEEKLLSVLRSMVQYQVSHVPVPKTRARLPKNRSRHLR